MAHIPYSTRVVGKSLFVFKEYYYYNLTKVALLLLIL